MLLALLLLYATIFRLDAFVQHAPIASIKYKTRLHSEFQRKSTPNKEPRISVKSSLINRERVKGNIKSKMTAVMSADDDMKSMPTSAPTLVGLVLLIALVFGLVSPTQSDVNGDIAAQAISEGMQVLKICFFCFYFSASHPPPAHMSFSQV